MSAPLERGPAKSGGSAHRALRFPSTRRIVPMPSRTRKPRGAPRRRTAKRPALTKRREPESLRLRSMAASLTHREAEHVAVPVGALRHVVHGERGWEDGSRLRGLQMKAGRCDLMLTQDDFAKGRDRKKGEGFRLWASTAQDIDALAARIKARGGRLDFEPHTTSWGAYAFAITDPDGYKITFIQEE